MRVGWADDNGATFRRRRVLLGSGRENDGDRRDAQIGEQISMLKRVAAQIDGEAGVVGIFHRLSIGKIGEHVVVRKSKTAPAGVGIDDGAQSRAINRCPVGARQIAGNVVTPQRTRYLREGFPELSLAAHLASLG